MDCNSCHLQSLWHSGFRNCLLEANQSLQIRSSTTPFGILVPETIFLGQTNLYKSYLAPLPLAFWFSKLSSWGKPISTNPIQHHSLWHSGARNYLLGANQSLQIWSSTTPFGTLVPETVFLWPINLYKSDPAPLPLAFWFSKLFSWGKPISTNPVQHHTLWHSGARNYFLGQTNLYKSDPAPLP